MKKKIDIYRKEIGKIKKVRGKLTAKILFEEAQDKDSPLHDYFIWDKNKGWYEWNLHRARVLLNVYKYELITKEGEVKVIDEIEFIRYDVGEENDENGEYKFYPEIMENKKWRNQIVMTAIKQISHWRKKYEAYAYREFSSLIQEIKKIERRFKLDGRKKRSSKNSSSSIKKERNKDKSKKH